MTPQRTVGAVTSAAGAGDSTPMALPCRDISSPVTRPCGPDDTGAT